MHIKFLVLALIVGSSVSLLGQEYRGTINGTVTDSRGAAIAGVKIHVSNADTGVGADTTSNQFGLYQVPFLIPGNYSITAEASGFKKEVQSSVRVDANANVTVNLSLAVGSVSESVSVGDRTRSLCAGPLSTQVFQHPLRVTSGLAVIQAQDHVRSPQSQDKQACEERGQCQRPLANLCEWNLKGCGIPLATEVGLPVRVDSKQVVDSYRR